MSWVIVNKQSSSRSLFLLLDVEPLNHRLHRNHDLVESINWALKIKLLMKNSYWFSCKYAKTCLAGNFVKLECNSYDNIHLLLFLLLWNCMPQCGRRGWWLEIVRFCWLRFCWLGSYWGLNLIIRRCQTINLTVGKDNGILKFSHFFKHTIKYLSYWSFREEKVGLMRACSVRTRIASYFKRLFLFWERTLKLYVLLFSSNFKNGLHVSAHHETNEFERIQLFLSLFQFSVFWPCELSIIYCWERHIVWGNSLHEPLFERIMIIVRWFLCC